jgi:hypothetical protein
MSQFPEITHIVLYTNTSNPLVIEVKKATNEELAIWISQALTYDKSHREWRKKIVKPYFTPPPWPSY